MALNFAFLCTAILFLSIGSFPLSTATHNSHCTYSSAVYSTRVNYYQTSYSVSYSYSCGFLWLSRCRGYRTRYQATAQYQLVVNYVSASTCCSGYSGSYPGCSPICSPDCLHGTCTHPNTCSCNSGWTGSTCNTDVCECCLNTDECSQNCHNTDGSYTCSCDTGYILNSDGQNCDDINECLTNNGGCHQVCTNTVGSFACSCLTGYEFDSDNNCININECERGIAGCSHNCMDTIGSFQCSCLTGYQLQIDGRSCEDINECSNSIYHSCIQNCHNTIGSYYCSCDGGYNLHDDGYNCTDIDECEEDVHGCNHHCNNTIGGFNCSCFVGYHLSDDNRTCIDTNECLDQNGNCQHNCINEIGSYYCTCRDGYTLGEDEASCTADPCTTIFAPTNGFMTCNGPQVTDTICAFSCEPGYNLTGSAIRSCQPNHTWSDTQTMCPPLECPHLSTTYTDADQVFVLAPCYSTYNFTCSLLCKDGYYLNGTDEWEQTCDLMGSDNNVAWTQEATCIESKPCDPSPCSVGVCSPGTNSLFICDCKETLRKGVQCEIGTVKVEPLPITAGQQFTIMYRSTPSKSITIILSFSQTYLKGQNTVTITAPQNESYSNIYISDQTSGLFTIKHTLEGEDLSDIVYDKPEDSVVLITDPITPYTDYFTANNLQSPLLSSGCCWYQYHFQSPTTSCLSHITFTSSCSWTDDSSSIIGTNGIVFLWKDNDLHLPVSIGGLSHDLSSSKFNVLGFSNKPQCSACTSCPNCTSNCATSNNYYSVNTHDIQLMLNKRSLLSTFFEKTISFLPSWLTLHVPAVAKAIGFHLFDYSAFIGSATEANKLYGCEKIPLSPTNLIYIIRSSSNMTLVISSNNFKNPPNYFNYTAQDSDSSPICYALDVCAGRSSKLHVGIPESLAEFISSFPSFQDFVTKGWILNYQFLSLAEFGFPVDLTNQAIWNGSHYTYITSNETSYDFQISFERLNGILTGGHLNGSLDFSGLLMHQRAMGTYYQAPTILDGTFQIIIVTNVGSEYVSLYLSSERTKMLLSDSGNSSIPQGGISTVLNYRLVPHDSATFFANLFIIPDYTSECSVDMYTQLTAMLDIDWITLASSCLGLRVGRLEFVSDMNNVLKLSGQSASHGAQNDYTILAESTLTVLEKQLGSHILLINTNNDPSLQLKYTSTTSQIRGTLYHSNVSIFDSVIYTDITIAGSVLTFVGITKIFEYYTISIMGSFTAEKPWDTTPFLLNCFIHDANYLYELNTYLYSYINNTANIAIEKRLNGQRSIDNAMQILSSIEVIRNTTLEELTNATVEYERTKSQVMYWNTTVNQALSIYTASLTAYVSDTNMLETLRNCSLRTCEEVCVIGTNCTTCYTDTTTVETGSCPTFETVTKTTKEAIPYYATGWRYERRSYWCRNFRRVRYSCQVTRRPCFKTVCVSYTQKRYRYVQRTFTVLELRQRPCVVEQYNTSSPMECCQVYPCSYTVPNAACLSQKEECLEQIQQIESQQSLLTDQYNAYLSAQQSLVLANVENTKKLVDLETLKQAMNLIQPAYESAKFNVETSLANFDAIKEETKDTFKLVEYLDTYGGSSQLIQMLNITFSQTIISETPFVFPVEIMYDTPFSGQTYTFTYSMNFLAPQEILRRSISEDILAHFMESNTTDNRRRRETTDVNTNTIYRQFQLRCIDLQNTQTYFNRLTSLLNNTIENIETIHIHILEAGNTSIILLNDVLQNVSNDSINSEYAKFSNNHNKSLSNILDLIESNGFSNWRTMVEMLHNKTDSVGGHKCFGLTDCLETSLTLMETLLSDIPGDEAKNILEILLNTKSSIIAIGYENHTLDEAMYKLTSVSELISSTDSLGYWCSAPPVITMNPPLEVNISIGQNLLLECGADSSIPIQYRWKKDGLYLSNQKSSTLYLTKMQLINAGDYICQATSSVGSTDALSTRVNVYYTPIMNLTLSDSQTIEGNDDGVNFACDAHSWPPPGWNWYFKPDRQSVWQKIEGSDANLLPLVDPHVQQEGWYKCEASNWIGQVSSTAYLTVLPVTIVRIMYPGEFIITTSDINTAMTNSGGGSGGTSTSLHQAIDNALTNYLGLQIAEIANVTVSSIDETKWSVSFILTTPLMDMNSSDIVPLKVEDILADIAFPMITELENAKLNLEKGFSINNTIGIAHDSGDIDEFDYLTVSESLQYSTRAFVCPNGYGLDAGLVFCVSCAPGTYQALPAIVMINIGNNRFIQEEHPQCLACPIGSYQSSKGTTQCNECLQYMTTASEGSNNMSSCIGMCEPMTYSMTGLKPCVPCPENHYQLYYGGIGCIMCNGSMTNDQCILDEETPSQDDTTLIIIIASSVGGGVLGICVFIIIIGVIVCMCWRQKKKYHVREGTNLPYAIPLNEHQYNTSHHPKEDKKKVNIEDNNLYTENEGIEGGVQIYEQIGEALETSMI